MSLKTIITEALNRNPLGLKEAFTEELNERLREVFAIEEEVETVLDEAITDRYKKGDHIVHTGQDRKSHHTAEIHDTSDKYNFTVKSKDGKHYDITKKSVIKKLGEEVEDLDEVSKEKLLNYIGNASVSKSHAAQEIGKVNQKRMDGTVTRDAAQVQAGANAIHGNRSGGIQLAAAKLAGKYADGYKVKVPATESVEEETDLEESVISYSAEYIKEKLKKNEWEIIHGQMLPNKPFNVKDKGNGKVSTIMYRS